ncbi:MAG: type V CRISPR-associated protein Cas12a/Cpf1 [Planctomycetia bacterium]|nr:type V CRISPR-associated protein Cas12a/Cpf1 [Planctomycetia bacterium]
MQKASDLLSRLKDFDQQRIYVSSAGVREIFQALFGSWELLRNQISEAAAQRVCTGKAKKKNKTDSKDMEYSLKFLDEVISAYFDDFHENTCRSVLEYWASTEEWSEEIREKYALLKTVFEKKYTAISPLHSQEEDISWIKDYLDQVMNFYHKIKILAASPEKDRDLEFYFDLDSILETLESVIPLYNTVRNSLTRKVGDVEKFKLNFDCSTLAHGWDKNKEQSNLCTIFLKDGNYYLGILNTKNKIKLEKLTDSDGGPFYQKMIYKYLTDSNKMLPKVFIHSKKWKMKNSLPAEIEEGYQQKKHIKDNKNFDLEFCRKLIDYYKESIKKYNRWHSYNFQFSETSSYNNISEFYNEVNAQSYKITFQNISASQVDRWVEDGKLFLFQIYNKDFAPGASGNPNIHTMYWQHLFSKENLENVIFKLDGNAELFYRPPSQNLGTKVIHQKGEKLVNRRLNDEDRTPVPEDIYGELCAFFNDKFPAENLSKEAAAWKDRVTVKEATHEIIKDRRYTKEQFQIHMKVTINFNANDDNNNAKKMNSSILKVLQEHPDDINIIGLDRGERNLVYLTIINPRGEILLQKSFNIVGEDRQKMNYHARLDDREKKRALAKKSWKQIGNIKDLKKGYISQVVHEIVTLMVQYNAIIVLEDLNFGFKRGRFHVEKQVYQKFEKALLDKLNYLVFKNHAVNEPAGVLKGLQLTSKEDPKSKNKNQNGILFYVPAGYTSKIDPLTGFVALLPFDDRVKPSQELYQKMDAIRYRAKEDYFEFSFDYKNYGKTSFSSPWNVCTFGEKRISSQKDSSGKWHPVNVNVTEEMKALFVEYEISFQNEKDILAEIISQTSGKFFKTLNWLLRLTLQLRYSNSQTGEDFILSPVRNSSGKFFRSSDDPYAPVPADADANGAYHIALKGLWLLQHGISPKKETNGKESTYSVSSISNENWFQFVRSRHEET